MNDVYLKMLVGIFCNLTSFSCTYNLVLLIQLLEGFTLDCIICTFIAEETVIVVGHFMFKIKCAKFCIVSTQSCK